VAIAISALCGYLLGVATGMSSGNSLWLWASAAAAATVGLADDLRGLRPAVKMLGHVVVAGTAVYFAGPALGLDQFWACAAAFSIVAFANIFNFMDGSDGLAAGMAVLFALGLAVLRSADSSGDLIFAASIAAAASAGFLVLNWGPASIFMGDTGSLFLGFLLAGLSWQVIAGGTGPLAVALIFLPFAGDAGWTMFQRARRGERLWTAHRSHIYQRLLIAGSTHRSVALLYYAWAGLAVQLARGYSRGDVAVRIVMLLLAVGSIVWMEVFVSVREREGASSRLDRSVADRRTALAG
jgi:UDP-N-acetylmuramyl pentapeptide phosphotransferase/UDP-N-acetylglucosamine-1-phosphate transferase